MQNDNVFIYLCNFINIYQDLIYLCSCLIQLIYFGDTVYMSTEFRKKVLYINHLNDMLISKLFVIKIDTYMKKYLEKFADIVDIIDLDMVKLNNYELIIINIMSIIPDINKLNPKLVSQKTSKIKEHHNVALYLHDLHDYSIKYSQNFLKLNIVVENGIKKYVPNLKDNIAKKEYQNLFNLYNIKYLISIYDCPEFDFFYTYFINIKKFYITSHGYCPKIFKPMDVEKKYDILFYGCDKKEIYPLRVRILNICQNMGLNVKKLDYTMGEKQDNKKQSEEVLCRYINQSWLCIACTSNFSYFVRKYLEISACYSLVIGDINKQGKQILNDNILEVTMEMSDIEIINKISHYLNNKNLIIEKIRKNHESLKKYTYRKVVRKIKNISKSILENSNCEHEYNNYKSGPE